MEEIRTISTALYNNASYESQAAVKDFFKSLDTDGSGSISKEEFMRYVKEIGMFTDPRFFPLLDEDGNGSLDLKELFAFFYFINFRGIACDVCRKFLFGLYFTCTRCWEERKPSYDLCLSCFQGKKHDHVHTQFLDNYAMLVAATRATTAASGATGDSQMVTYRSEATRTSRADQFIRAVDAVTNIVGTAASFGFCTIM